MSEPLFVDPEALTKLGLPWNAAAQEWHLLSGVLAEIRSRYNGCWGNDEIGNKFGPEFLEGFYALEEQLTQMGEALGYYGGGLQSNGMIYAGAREEAEESTHGFLAETEEYAQTPQNQYAHQRQRGEQVAYESSKPKQPIYESVHPGPGKPRVQEAFMSVGPGDPGFEDQAHPRFRRTVHPGDPEFEGEGGVHLRGRAVPAPPGVVGVRFAGFDMSMSISRKTEEGELPAPKQQPAQERLPGIPALPLEGNIPASRKLLPNGEVEPGLPATVLYGENTHARWRGELTGEVEKPEPGNS